MILALAAAYFISTQLSFALVAPQFGLAAFWPAAGVLAGGLAILSPADRRWLLAAVFALVLIPNALGGVPFVRAIVFASANCLEGIVFVAFYQHGRWDPQVRTPRDMGHFLAAGFFACAIAGAVGAVGLRYLANGEQNLMSWLFWVMADFVGIFAVTPVLLFLRRPPADRRISGESGIALAGSIGAVAAAFLIPFPAAWMQLAPLGIAAPFVLWCAIRGSIFANAILTLAITIIAIVAITYSLGPLSGYSPLSDRILATQLFILRACGGSVLLAVLFEERRRRESQLRTIIDTVPVGLILTGSSGRVIGGNRYVEELLGHDVLSSTDLSALGRARAFDGNDDPVDQRHFPWARLAGEEAEEPALDVNYRRDDGSYTWLRLLSRQVRDPGGASVGNVFALVNIDEEKKAWNRVQTEVDNLQIRLMQTSRASAMGTMASALAHELNQPLAAVVNYLQAARRIMASNPADRADQLKGAIETAEGCAMRAGEIIRRLRRTLSRGDAETGPARVVELVEESIAMACPLRGGTPASFELDIAPNLFVEVDGVQIQQVLINLITNAFEAMEGCAIRKIVIGARRRARMIEISVTDSGPGFAQEVRDKLFEPFVSTKDQGMGVGLSICRTIVERHGGRIQASEGLPTRIAVTLPAVARDARLAA
jgi:two-component system sensor kinase FixL